MREVIFVIREVVNKMRGGGIVAVMISILEVFLLLQVLFINPYYSECTLFNLLLLLPLTGIFWLLQLPAKALYIVQGAVLFFVYYLNTYVLASRQRPIHFMDIYSIKDAMQMSGNYPLVFDARIGYRLLLTVLIVFLCCYAHHRLQLPRIKAGVKCAAGGSMAVLSCALFLLIRMCGGMEFEQLQFNEDLYIQENGLFYAWYCEYENSTIHEPDRYSAEYASEILTAYAEEETEEKAVPDNVIVIMNESFMDYSLIGETDFAADPLPFLHQLEKNCIQGKLCVNIYGGNTCNSEFEFLTGYSLAFLPENSVPYVQYPMQGISSMAHEMTELHYRNTAVHPYYAQEWKRETIYEELGFQDFISGEDLSENYVEDEKVDIFMTVGDGEKDNFGDDLEYVRSFISDAECLRTIQEVLAADAEKGEDSFIFSITIQNHGGYEDELSAQFGGVDYLGTGENCAQNTFLNLTSLSDKAFGDLLTALETAPEKTVVLMFGDHQPALEFQPYMTMYSDKQNPYECNADKYTVPYVMWANYDVNWEEHEILSVNYLSALLKQNCNLPLNAFDQLRLAAMEEYPVLTCGFAVDKNGEYVSPQTAMESEIVQEYEIIQYQKMFDR